MTLLTTTPAPWTDRGKATSPCIADAEIPTLPPYEEIRVTKAMAREAGYTPFDYLAHHSATVKALATDGIGEDKFTAMAIDSLFQHLYLSVTQGRN